MFGKPSSSKVVAIATAGLIAFLAIYTLLALLLTELSVRCGPACGALIGALHP